MDDIICPGSCLNHILVTSVDIILVSILLSVFLCKPSNGNILSHQQSPCFSTMLNSAVLVNGGLGLGYLALGLIEESTMLPLHGFAWFVLILVARSKRHQLLHTSRLKLCSVLAVFISGFLCGTSLWEAVVGGSSVSVKMILDVVSFPGAIPLMCCSFSGTKNAGPGSDLDDAGFYTGLPGHKIKLDANFSPFEKAGFISRLSFWWLNPLMQKGKEKILEDKDIPELRREDQAEMCYLMFMEKQNRRSSSSPSIVLTLFSWQRKQILVSGFCALVKVLTLSTGPLFLRAFIMVAEGKETFKYEGYALTGGLFLTKCLESLSERQWSLRTRLIGLQVRSFLSAAIYEKQLKLSNSAKSSYSPGQIMNFVTIDAHKIGEYPYMFHQIWSTILQLCLALLIIYYSVGLATIAALLVVILTVVANSPLGRLLHKYQKMLMGTQDKRMKAFTEALTNMKILKLYAWETHFKNVIKGLRTDEFKWLSSVLSLRGYSLILFWSSPILVPAVTFWACYFLGTNLSAGNVFTFMASLRLAQEPILLIPDVVAAFIEAKVSLNRIADFLNAPELQKEQVRKTSDGKELKKSILIRSDRISWEEDSKRATLRSINLMVMPGEKVAVCGEVGSGKSTLLAAILGEVPHVNGIVQVYGKIAYVSQIAWIPTGTIQENILFGSAMDPYRYKEAIEKCSLVKDLEMLPFGDLTEIGERGINLSGGQKQRVQLARALYQDADVYLLDDPFSAVDAHTATYLFNEYVMEALSTKTVILVTHQVDFLPAFDSVLLMSQGEIQQAATYNQLMQTCQEFRDLVNAHSAKVGSERQQPEHDSTQKSKIPSREIQRIYTEEHSRETSGEQLIKKEERELGEHGLKPYLQYLKYSKGFLYFFLATLAHVMFIVGQLGQNYWLASNVQSSSVVSQLKLIAVYTGIGLSLSLFLLLRSFLVVRLGLGASESVFSALLNSLFRAPMSFFDSTPTGRILSRVSFDMNAVDLDVAFKFTFAVGSALNAYASFGVLTILAWELVFVILPTIYISIIIQRYYFAAGNALMRINGTTKSLVSSHLAESINGAMTIRAFGDEDRHIRKNWGFIDTNASPFFYSFTANEWLIQRLEILCAVVLSSSALALTLLQTSASKSGFIGMALSYGLSLNAFLVFSVQTQCHLANMIVSVERLEQYMRIPSEAPEIIESNRPPLSWPAMGEVEICDLKVRYQPNAPLVLQGISCKFGGGQKIGVVGRTGSGKTTLISALFRLVEPIGGRIVIDGINISTIGLHDLRSGLGIIPQEPTLFSGSVRYNLDPLSMHTDKEIWEVLEKCQLQGAIQEKEEGLDSLVTQDGSNWSMGQRQLFCLGRALLKRNRILVLDEATASIDNATDTILQRTIRTEFADSTVITVAHRIPTVMDCTMVLAISDGKLVEFDEPMKLMKEEGSLFGELVKEYWSRSSN